MNALEWCLTLASSIFPLSSLFFFFNSSKMVSHSFSFSFRGMKSYLRITFDGLYSMHVYVNHQCTRVSMLCLIGS
jgi:hypothetical protein